MAAQIQINTGIRKLRQFPRFMIDDDNRLIRIQIPCNLFRCFPAGYTAPGTFIIRSAIKIKGIINQNTLIPKQGDPGFFKKNIHLRIAHFFTILRKGKSGQNRLLNIVVSVAGIGAVSTLKSGKDFSQFFRLVKRFIFVVKNIPCNDNQIRILGIDFVNHLTHLGSADTVSEMQICHKGDLKRIQIPGLLINRHLIRSDPDETCIEHSINADRGNQKKADRSGKCRAETVKGFLSYFSDNETYQVGCDDNQSRVEHDAHPVVTEPF